MYTHIHSLLLHVCITHRCNALVRADTISFVVLAIVGHAPRAKCPLVEPMYISTCISRIDNHYNYLRDFCIYHTQRSTTIKV